MKKFKKIIYILLIFLILPFLIANFSFASEQLETYSAADLIVESSTGKIIYEKNSREKRYPASTTKVMTALLTL